MEQRTPTQTEKRFWAQMTNLHSPDACADESACPVHKPSRHHMRRWPLHWRDDRGILERICPHGIGHPDPDQREFWEKTGQQHQNVHGCDFCCADPLVNYETLD